MCRMQKLRCTFAWKQNKSFSAPCKITSLKLAEVADEIRCAVGKDESYCGWTKSVCTNHCLLVFAGESSFRLRWCEMDFGHPQYVATKATPPRPQRHPSTGGRVTDLPWSVNFSSDIIIGRGWLGVVGTVNGGPFRNSRCKRPHLPVFSHVSGRDRTFLLWTMCLQHDMPV